VQLRDAVDLEKEMAKKRMRPGSILVGYWIDEIRAKSPWKSTEDDSLWKRTCDVRYERKTLKSLGWGVDNISCFSLPTHSPPTNPIKMRRGKEKQFGLDLLFVSGPRVLALTVKSFGRWPVTKTHDFSRPHR
jgi:hypothetical protein